MRHWAKQRISENESSGIYQKVIIDLTAAINMKKFTYQIAEYSKGQHQTRKIISRDMK